MKESPQSSEASYGEALLEEFTHRFSRRDEQTAFLIRLATIAITMSEHQQGKEAEELHELLTFAGNPLLAEVDTKYQITSKRKERALLLLERFIPICTIH